MPDQNCRKYDRIQRSAQVGGIGDGDKWPAVETGKEVMAQAGYLSAAAVTAMRFGRRNVGMTAEA